MSCEILRKLEEVIRRRIEEKNPESYTYRLYSSGIHNVARKVGEEAVEVAVAALAEGKSRIVEEAADLLYHLLVLLNSTGLSLGDVCAELERRMR
ncbi:phosphoribosyl-ATP pyrophosphatase [Pyrobaculum islandicum DSM 4184]|uniref:Phosphoribosyl-ATP pyrophosphatase n=1 Tax=Pyrobaculum islandicum (strain DSM 4184 / JCM 9189 / GEO3) TaxID=384616 RepID=HIS2_PYRIL|nr:phosphoribosyl-ATP diphosphatase [Pyrobaculum islandicum]A1RTU9.1 RecName: Full=Phosphoribosyl-ATP pyrophosphatase; Short=PRA-PH [Pyrobaculum islandicum DSM 4184]ABL88381.1 phosphoribosyl-ATP pyrophosphatase [Pyrobaculum islandicum DSM 4184]